MYLSKIMTSFHTYERNWICQFDRNTDIYSFTFLSGTEVFESNVLYFGYVSELPLIPPEYRVTFICIEDTPVPATYRTEAISSLNLITFRKDATEMKILKILTQLFGEAARVSSGRSQLVNALHGNQGISAIIDQAYEILQNPIVLADASYKILGMSQGFSEDDERNDLLEQKNLGFMLKSNIDAMNKDRIYEQAREKKYPFYYRNPDKKQGWITALVYIHGIEVGQIGVMDSRHPFSDVDFELVDFLCKVISLELQKSDFYRENRGLMHSYFLSDLLDNQIRDHGAIEQRMASLNWKLSSNLYLVLLSDSAKNFFDGKAQLITQQLHHMLPESRWVIYHGQIVFLISSADPVSDSVFATLEEYLRINHLTASISNRFESVVHIRNSYKQASHAYDYGQRFHPERAIHYYYDYIVYHMGDIIGAEHDLTDFYHPSIVSIREYDRIHNTNFLQTLSLYLTLIDQPALIAERLYIHKNTVFYRISKLKEQFHLQLDNGDERLRIHMTIKLMELENNSVL